MRRSLALSSSLALLVVACSTAPAEDPEEGKARQVASAIINGSVDTSHQAVVAIISQSGNEGGACSGTIIHTDPAKKIGWVLTAAHCVTLSPVLVIQGDDYAAADALRYEVVDYEADGRYSGQTSSSYDFAIVRIAGVDASTPTIAIADSPDGISEGTGVTSIGYGRTTLIASGDPDPNTVRRLVKLTLSDVGSTQIGFDMSSRGICQGDSGGPDLVKTSGGERVVGVHSYVQGDCDGFGVSGRASASISFVNGQLSKPVSLDACELCEKAANSGEQECASLTRDCFADSECKGYYECLSNGEKPATCVTKFPKAEGPFNAAANCTCDRACADECKKTLRCITTPKCGYKLPSGDCTTCTESSCCAETLDCAADGDCYLCLKNNDEDEACASNPARKKLANCVASSCADECAGSGLDTGADPASEDGDGSSGGGTKTITKTEGCSIAAGGSGAASSAPWLLALGLRALVTSRRRRARSRRG